MGLAGPLKLAAEHLAGSEPFFVLNSDVVCDFPFTEMIAFHKAHGKEGTLVVRAFFITSIVKSSSSVEGRCDGSAVQCDGSTVQL